MGEVTGISELFAEIIDFAVASGVRDINKLPGCWETDIDEHWSLAVNGHAKAIACSHGPSVPPYSAYVQFNGWPAGVIDLHGGVLAAGKLANEASLIAAIQTKISRLCTGEGVR